MLSIKQSGTLGGLDQAVPHPGLGDKQFRMCRVSFQLATDLVGVDTQVVELTPVRGPPDSFEQDVVPDQPAVSTGQLSQHSPLGRGEVNSRAVTGSVRLAEVEHDMVRFERGDSNERMPAAPQPGADSCHELFHAERLGDVVVGSFIEGLDLVIGVVAG